MGECILIQHGSQGALPVGAIVLWSGAADQIPSGWLLCDGTQGTPDLRGRFVVGAGGSYAVGNTGGEASHRLTVSEMPSHSHRLDKWLDYSDRTQTGVMVDTACKMSTGGLSTSSAGSGSAHENRPPYYALCYIMRAI